MRVNWTERESLGTRLADRVLWIIMLPETVNCIYMYIYIVHCIGITFLPSYYTPCTCTYYNTRILPCVVLY